MYHSAPHTVKVNIRVQLLQDIDLSAKLQPGIVWGESQDLMINACRSLFFVTSLDINMF